MAKDIHQIWTMMLYSCIARIMNIFYSIGKVSYHTAPAIKIINWFRHSSMYPCLHILHGIDKTQSDIHPIKLKDTAAYQYVLLLHRKRALNKTENMRSLFRCSCVKRDYHSVMERIKISESLIWGHALCSTERQFVLGKSAYTTIDRYINSVLWHSWW